MKSFKSIIAVSATFLALGVATLDAQARGPGGGQGGGGQSMGQMGGQGSGGQGSSHLSLIHI